MVEKYRHQPLTLATGGAHTVALPPQVFRARLTGLLFERDKAFLLPGAMAGIRGLRRYYEDHLGLQVLVTGHTDTVGDAGYNEGLAAERAVAVAAYLTDDVDAWLGHYAAGGNSQPWSTREDQHMLSALPADRPPYYGGPVDGAPGPATRAAVVAFQRDHGLADDGVAGPVTRRALIADYMALDGTTLPPGVPLLTHGCGEAHPAVPTPDDTDLLANRRVEVFLFEGPIDPPPRAPCRGCPEYPQWVRRTVHTLDLGVDAGWLDAAVVSAFGHPLAGAQIALAGPIRVAATTGDDGTARVSDLPCGSYEIEVSRPPLAPARGTVTIGRGEPAAVVPAPAHDRASGAPVARFLPVAGPDGTAGAQPVATSTVAEVAGNAVAAALVPSWFLSTEPTSDAAFVTWHVGYLAYYRRLEQIFTQTGPGDEIFIVGWRLETDQVLSTNTLELLLTSAVGRRCKVRALISQFSDASAANAASVGVINGLGGTAVLDDQHLWQGWPTTPGSVGTFHQKAIYVRVGGVGRLFVGGMDIASGRTLPPPPSPTVPPVKQSPPTTNEWLDTAVEITGAAAELGRHTLEVRWASKQGGSVPVAPSGGAGAGDARVQFVRTYARPDAHATAHGRTYAPGGDYTIQELLRTACAQAEQFIYIEDQYLVGDRVGGQAPRGLPSLDVALAAAVNRGVTLIGVATWDVQIEDKVPRARRGDLLGACGNAGRVHLLNFQAKHVSGVTNYVHSKTWIFDDQFAVVGSANYSRMSMTWEAEFSVGVSGARVPELRRSMWLAVLNAPTTPGGFTTADVADWRTGLASLRSSRSPLQAYAKLGTDQFSVPFDPDGS